MAEPDMAEPDAAPACAADETRPCPLADDCLGQSACVDGAFGPCAAPDELCNGSDGDCDGQTDEGFAGGQPCATGVDGVCAAGLTACVDGAPGCAPVAEAADELCDGLGNDCDGVIDEGEVCRDGALVCEGEDGWMCTAASPDPVPCPDGVEPDASLALFPGESLPGAGGLGGFLESASCPAGQVVIGMDVEEDVVSRPRRPRAYCAELIVGEVVELVPAWVTEPIGNGGGGPLDVIMCPVGEAVVGYRAWVSADLVTAVQLVCAPLAYADGRLVAGPTSLTAATHARAEAPVEARCAEGGVAGAVGDRVGGLIDRFSVRCDSLQPQCTDPSVCTRAGACAYGFAGPALPAPFAALPEGGWRVEPAGGGAARSAAVDEPSLDRLALADVQLSSGGRVGFRYRVDAPSGDERFTFAVDGRVVLDVRESVDWTAFSVNVAPGDRAFEWAFARAAGIAEVDDVRVERALGLCSPARPRPSSPGLRAGALRLPRRAGGRRHRRAPRRADRSLLPALRSHRRRVRRPGVRPHPRVRLRLRGPGAARRLRGAAGRRLAHDPSASQGEPLCVGEPGEPVGDELCDGGLDEDWDGLVDCDDPDCGRDAACNCGDGLLQTGEQCDDGDLEAGDGCGPDCTIEPGWQCERPALGECLDGAEPDTFVPEPGYFLPGTGGASGDPQTAACPPGQVISGIEGEVWFDFNLFQRAFIAQPRGGCAELVIGRHAHVVPTGATEPLGVLPPSDPANGSYEVQSCPEDTVATGYRATIAGDGVVGYRVSGAWLVCAALRREGGRVVHGEKIVTEVLNANAIGSTTGFQCPDGHVAGAIGERAGGAYDRMSLRCDPLVPACSVPSSCAPTD